MSIIEGKCPNCGAPLKVDTSKDAAICEYCNTPYVTEKAIHVAGDYIQNQNVTNVNVKQDNEYTAKKSDNVLLSVLMVGCVIIIVLFFIFAIRVST